MNTRRLTSAFLLALLCSGLLTWQLSRHLPRPVAAAPTVLITRQIVIASKDMQAGDVVTSNSLNSIDWPSSAVPLGSFSKLQDVAGRVLLYPVASGEPILIHDLAAPDAGTGLTALIPDGMRAISLHADETMGVSGFISPNSHVDVLVTYPAGNGVGFVSAMVLQNARVLAIGQKDDTLKEPKLGPLNTVTLLVTPQDAAKVTTAGSLGKILLALRNGADRSLAPGLSQMAFASGPATPEHAATVSNQPKGHTTAEQSSKAGFTVETLSGGKKTEQTFQEEQP